MNRCSLCPNIHKCIAGDGPLDSSIMFVGEAPGITEEKEGKVFIGKTGREVNEHYLPLAGLRRSNVYFTNAIKCLPSGHGGKLDIGRSKDIELLYSCSDHSLYGEIETIRPRLIVPMGAFACHAIDPDIELDLQHGMPIQTSFGVAFPLWHPAGGVHEPKKMLQIRTDFYRLGRYLKGKLYMPQDEYPNPNYGVINRPIIDTDRPLACDTEVTRFREPYCLTFSGQPGTGWLIMADNHDALNWFQMVLDRQRGPILFHNFLFDQRVVSDMGLHFPFKLVADTMSRAFHLGNLPQGLKALARRELGMVMEDFDDIVTPYSVPLCLDYLKQAALKSWPKPEEQLVRDKDGQWKLYKPQSISTKLKRFFTDYSNNETKDIFGAWDNWESDHRMIEEVCGPWPGKDIRYVPFDKVLHYACRDADVTLRLWLREQQMTRRVRRAVQEQWGDVA